MFALFLKQQLKYFLKKFSHIQIFFKITINLFFI